MHLKELFSLINKHVEDYEKKQGYYELVRDALASRHPHTLDEYLESVEDYPLGDEWFAMCNEVLKEDDAQEDEDDIEDEDDVEDDKEELRQELSDLQMEQMLYLKRLDDMSKQYALQIRRLERLAKKLQ